MASTGEKKKTPFRDLSLIGFALFAIVTAATCYAKGGDIFHKGWDDALATLLQIFPKVVGAILIAGFVQVLVPRQLVIKWMGEKSGWKGLLIACVVGILTPGGPMVSFPLIAALRSLGATVGTLVAYLLSWELMGIQRLLIWDIPIMGVKFTLLRLSLSFFFPLLSGLIAQKLTLYFADTVKEGV